MRGNIKGNASLSPSKPTPIWLQMGPRRPEGDRGYRFVTVGYRFRDGFYVDHFWDKSFHKNKSSCESSDEASAELSCEIPIESSSKKIVPHFCGHFGSLDRSSG